MYNGPYYDNEGNEIKEGHVVVFNYSGAIKKGIVKSIGSVDFKRSTFPSYWHNPPTNNKPGRCTVKIQHYGSNKISIVKNSHGILIIE